jgi:hypothetical protein
MGVAKAINKNTVRIRVCENALKSVPGDGNAGDLTASFAYARKYISTTMSIALTAHPASRALRGNSPGPKSRFLEM